MKKEINRIAINSRRRLHCQLATFHAKANLIFNSLPRSSSSAWSCSLSGVYIEVS